MSKIDKRFIKTTGDNAFTQSELDSDVLLFDDFESLSADWKLYKNPSGATPTDGAEAVSSLTNTKSVQFDGAGDYGNVTKGADISTGITTAMTVSAWVYANSLGGVSHTIMHHYDTAGNNRKWWLRTFNDVPTNGGIDSLSLGCYSGDGTAYVFTMTSDPLIPNQWNHVAATWDSGTIKLYVNGAEASQLTPLTAGSLTTLAANGGPIEIGGYSPTSNYYWDGYIDEPTVWDVALSATEIADIFNNGLPKDFARSVSFNGTDEYASVTPSATLGTGITTAMTVSAWVKHDAYAANLGTIANQWLPTGDQRKWFFATESDGTVRFLADQEGTNTNRTIWNTPSNTLALDTWYHVAAVFDGGTQSCQIYIDGSPVTTSVTAQNGTVPTNLQANGGDVEIGAWTSSGLTQSDVSFNGKITHVTVWNTNLSSGEITELYNDLGDVSGHSAYANLVSWWKMDGSDTSPTLTDSKGTDDLAMTNMDASNFVVDTSPLIAKTPVSWWRMGDGDTAPTITDQIGTNDCTLQNSMDASNIVETPGQVLPSLTLTSETGSNVLTGSAAGKLTKQASNVQGEGISRDFAVDRFYRGQTVDIHIKYLTGAGYVNNHYIVTFYDITNDSVIAVGGVATIPTSATNGSWYSDTVTIPSTCENMRVIIHSATTDATAFDLIVDDIKINAVLP